MSEYREYKRKQRRSRENLSAYEPTNIIKIIWQAFFLPVFRLSRIALTFKIDSIGHLIIDCIILGGEVAAFFYFGLWQVSTGILGILFLALLGGLSGKFRPKPLELPRDSTGRLIPDFGDEYDDILEVAPRKNTKEPRFAFIKDSRDLCTPTDKLAAFSRNNKEYKKKLRDANMPTTPYAYGGNGDEDINAWKHFDQNTPPEIIEDFIRKHPEMVRGWKRE